VKQISRIPLSGQWVLMPQAVTANSWAFSTEQPDAGTSLSSALGIRASFGFREFGFRISALTKVRQRVLLNPPQTAMHPARGGGRNYWQTWMSIL